MHGRMLLYVGRASEAEQEMRQALAENPNQFKAMAFLGEFLYYQGKLDEAEPVLKRAEELSRGSGDDSAQFMAAFLYASKGERDKIDGKILKARPREVTDGDAAYWTGGIHALLGDREEALAWLRRAVEVGNHNYPWFSAGQELQIRWPFFSPNTSASWKKLTAALGKYKQLLVNLTPCGRRKILS